MKVAALILALIFTVNAKAGDIDFSGMIKEVEAGIAQQTQTFGPTSERIAPRAAASEAYQLNMEINVDQGVVLVDSNGVAETMHIDMGE